MWLGSGSSAFGLLTSTQPHAVLNTNLQKGFYTTKILKFGIQIIR
jgi:hypothetical protein